MGGSRSFRQGQGEGGGEVFSFDNVSVLYLANEGRWDPASSRRGPYQLSLLRKPSIQAKAGH